MKEKKVISVQEKIARDYQIEARQRGGEGRKDKSSVVITPQEAVDFINRSVAEILKSEFGAELGDENVNVIDPFAGTGIFAAGLMEGETHKGEPLVKPNKMKKFAENLTCIEKDKQGAEICKKNLEAIYRQQTGETREMRVIVGDTFLMIDLP